MEIPVEGTNVCRTGRRRVSVILLLPLLAGRLLLADGSGARAVAPALAWGTYLGGSGSDVAYGLAVDQAGAVYVCGTTASADFPLRGQVSILGARGDRDAFVVKLSPNGSRTEYTVILGGNGYDEARKIAVDAEGNAYVVGRTSSRNFPTAGPVQEAYGGGDYDTFVAKLDPTGSSLIYSTYLGGSGSEYPGAIAVDGEGYAYVGGATASTDFPSVRPLASTRPPQVWTHAFLVKLNPSGSAMEYSVYLGGTQEERVTALAVDPEGNVYLTGYTRSNDFPLVDPFQRGFGGGTQFGRGDAYLAKVDAAATTLLYSTYLGGANDDVALGMALDGDGNIYVGGQTYSLNFPTLNPIQAEKGSSTSLTGAFLSKLNPGKSGLVYSTYLGGGTALISTVALDGAGNVHVAGNTGGRDFPLVSAFQASYGDWGDGFLASVDPTGSSLLFSSFLGGRAIDEVEGIAWDGWGNLYVTGCTTSDNFPTTPGAVQTRMTGVPRLPPINSLCYAQTGDAFVVKLSGFLEPETIQPEAH